MFCTIINDCRDANAAARQQVRTTSLLDVTPVFISVKNDLEAAGNLIDTLDAAGDSEGIILVNVAPRQGKAKQWPNGTPFGYFKYKNVLIFSSVDGYTLSLAKKYRLAKNIELFNIDEIADFTSQNNLLETDAADYLKETQFRSYEFLPRVAAWITQGIKIPTNKYSFSEVAEITDSVWWIDNFGNVKTTVLSSEIKDKQKLSTSWGEVEIYKRLKDVPDNMPAFITGSSGLSYDRLVEFIIQGKPAASQYSIEVGHSIYKETITTRDLLAAPALNLNS